MMQIDMERDTEARPTFGAWLLAQKNKPGAVGDLPKIAATDRAFPREGTAHDVRKHLNQLQADRMLFEVVDDAETDWLAF